MSKLLKQSHTTTPPYALIEGLHPTSVVHRPHSPAKISFSDGSSETSACLRCPDPPCMSFAPSEVRSTSLDGFPADTSPQTCAAGAMTIDLAVAVPDIDPDRCVACGVCASRCPAGAIFITDGLGAVVAGGIPSPRAFAQATDESHFSFAATLAELIASPHEGTIAVESDELFQRSATVMDRVASVIGEGFAQHHVRNLLIALGQGASMRRRGNNHMRMDLLLGSPGIARGAVEVEFGQIAAIEAPRDMLDSIAVLSSRHDWKADEIVTLIVTDKLPNSRSGYWDVIADIKQVTDISIGTVTTFALHLAIWLRKPLPDPSLFYSDRASAGYRARVLQVIAGRELRISADAFPQIEIAK